MKIKEEQNPTWRAQAKAVIQETLRALPLDASDEMKRTMLFKAYPFGSRDYYPYTCWCQEVRKVLSGPNRNLMQGVTDGGRRRGAY